MGWNRYAIYWLPDGALARVGAAWLGWDVRRGSAVPGADAATDGPRRYGFHATLKPPFRLQGSESDLVGAATALARSLPAVGPQPLEVENLGRFLAIRPKDDAPARRLAADFVEGLDSFRVPSTPEDLARRRAAGLTAAQDALLVRWGYPYVMDEHRLHLTLTGPNPPEGSEARARAHFEDVLSGPHGIASVALVGEDAEGRFHLIHDLPLRPHAAGP
ncbi:MAG: DUF1045 domain-containing protein [Jannaschia sp.]